MIAMKYQNDNWCSFHLETNPLHVRKHTFFIFLSSLLKNLSISSRYQAHCAFFSSLILKNLIWVADLQVAREIVSVLKATYLIFFGQKLRMVTFRSWLRSRNSAKLPTSFQRITAQKSTQWIDDSDQVRGETCGTFS